MADEFGWNPSQDRAPRFTSPFLCKIEPTYIDKRSLLRANNLTDETKCEQIEILLVEDNPGDVRLTIEALKEEKVANRINVAADGIEAKAFLHQEGKYEKAPKPDLILLDLNLPKKNGREVLAEIKLDANLKSIPVVILTSSQAEKDIVATYNLHANCYITKPVDFDQFINVVRSIEEFWFKLVKLPPRRESN